MNESSLSDQLTNLGHWLEHETGDTLRSGAADVVELQSDSPKRTPYFGIAAAAASVLLVGWLALGSTGSNGNISTPASVVTTTPSTAPTTTSPAPGSSTTSTSSSAVTQQPVGVLERAASGPAPYEEGASDIRHFSIEGRPAASLYRLDLAGNPGSCLTLEGGAHICRTDLIDMEGTAQIVGAPGERSLVWFGMPEVAEVDVRYESGLVSGAALDGLIYLPLVDLADGMAVDVTLHRLDQPELNVRLITPDVSIAVSPSTRTRAFDTEKLVAIEGMEFLGGRNYDGAQAQLQRDAADDRIQLVGRGSLLERPRVAVRVIRGFSSVDQFENKPSPVQTRVVDGVELLVKKAESTTVFRETPAGVLVVSGSNLSDEDLAWAATRVLPIDAAPGIAFEPTIDPGLPEFEVANGTHMVDSWDAGFEGGGGRVNYSREIQTLDEALTYQGYLYRADGPFELSVRTLPFGDVVIVESPDLTQMLWAGERGRGSHSLRWDSGYTVDEIIDRLVFLSFDEMVDRYPTLADRVALVEGWMAETPLPEGTDASPLIRRFDGAVTGANVLNDGIACIWMREWRSAAESGDSERAEVALAELEAAGEWPSNSLEAWTVRGRNPRQSDFTELVAEIRAGTIDAVSGLPADLHYQRDSWWCP